MKLYDICIFHYPCQDGLVSAWITNLYHQKNNKNIELYPIQHGNPLDINRLKNKKIIFCDYSPSLEVLDSIEEVVENITILDHHKTAMEVLQNKSYAIFDMNQSGAGLTWRYFFPLEKVPDFILYVEDRDIWKWEYNLSKPFTTGFMDRCKDCNDFILLFTFCDNAYQSPEQYIDKGNELIDGINKMIQEIIDTPIISGKYNDYTYRMVECPPLLVSDTGAMIAKDYDFVILWQKLDNNYKISLRSKECDVSIIAKTFGGGGHKNAASFISNNIPF